jgi:hypothetical protein
MGILLILAAVALAGPARAEPPPAPSNGGDLACDSPVAPGDTAASLKTRFGAAAKPTRLRGSEGEDLHALALYPDDKARRLDVVFEDAAMTRASGYYLPAERSKWAIAGLAPGADVQAVEAANGGPFDISGFEWDNGGQTVNYRGGKLQKLPGGCTLMIQFELKGEAPDDMVGDGVKIASTDKRLRARAKVSAIMVNFPARP